MLWRRSKGVHIVASVIAAAPEASRQSILRGRVIPSVLSARYSRLLGYTPYQKLIKNPLEFIFFYFLIFEIIFIHETVCDAFLSKWHGASSVNITHNMVVIFQRIWSRSPCFGYGCRFQLLPESELIYRESKDDISNSSADPTKLWMRYYV